MHGAGTIRTAAASIAAGIICGALFAVSPARAETCQGHPDALGTSRTLMVSPKQYLQVGMMQYPQTLPLADHEVVITFDDGPLPPWSDETLDILTAQCVKATFFIIGKMARQYPDVVRREYEAGETIGTHSEDHPQNFQKLSGDKLSAQIDGGIATVSAVLGDPNDVAPFFRIPGLGRAPVVENALSARGLVVFSSDVVADDWYHHIGPAQIIERAMSRLEKRGRGILLLHDIHPATVAALPLLLKSLKDNGFHVVQVVPPPLTGSEIAGGPRAWSLAAASPQPELVDKGAVSPAWPQVSPNPRTDVAALPSPGAAAFKPVELSTAGADLVNGKAPTVAWPNLSSDFSPGTAEAKLPTPGLQDIGISLRDGILISTEPRARTNTPPAAARPRARNIRFHVRHPLRPAHRADVPLGLALLPAFSAA